MTNMQDVCENDYSLKQFTKKFKLPKVVRVVSGIYDMLDEISLSREEILTLHSLKNYDTVKATDGEGCTFYLPLNITSKVAVVPPELPDNRRDIFVDVESLADDFPPLVTSTHSHHWLGLDAGDILKPIQSWITNPKEGYLQCSILNKPLNDDIFIPLSYQAEFERLENTNRNSLFLKEVVSNYSMPVKVRFLENRVVMQKHDLNSGRPTSIDSLGIITLLAQCDLTLVVATSIDPDSGKVHSLLNLPQDLDITIVPYPGSLKRSKKNSSNLLDFCDTSFVYGSTIIDERQLEDSESHGYEDVFPRLFPRKKPGAPSRFKHRYDLGKTGVKPNDIDENSNDSHVNSSHGDDFLCNSNRCKDGDAAVDVIFSRQNRNSSNGTDAESSVFEVDTSFQGTIGNDSEALNARCRNKRGDEEHFDKKVSVDVIKEFEKFQASLKFYHRPNRFKEKSPYVEEVNVDETCDGGETSNSGDGGECRRYSNDKDSNGNFLASLKLSSEQQAKNDSGEYCESKEKLVSKDSTDHSFGVEDEAVNGHECRGHINEDDERFQTTSVNEKVVGLNETSTDCVVCGCNNGGDDIVGDYSKSNHTRESALINTNREQVVFNDDILTINSAAENSGLAQKDTDTDVSNCTTASSIKTIENQYQALSVSTIASPETRLRTLKKLREQRCFLEKTPDTELIIHRHRSKFEGGTIPTGILPGKSEAPRTFLRSQTLTDSFLHCKEDNEGLCDLRTIPRVTSPPSVSIGCDGEYEKYLYLNTSPAPSPPQYNTLPASLSRKSKRKGSGKGSLKKLTIFSRKRLSRSQSTTDVDKYSYAYVESRSNATSNRKTDIGKILDIRKVFRKKGKDNDPAKVAHADDGFQTITRDHLKTFDVNQVCALLTSLSLDRYTKNFKEARIDGSLLVDLTDRMLIELEVDKDVDRHKLRKLIDEGWLPKESKLVC